MRTAEFFAADDPRTGLFPVAELALADSAAIGSGGIHLFNYADSQFELFAKLIYQPKSDRYLVCYSLGGAVSPQAALDLFFAKTFEFAQSEQLQYVYAARPKTLKSPELEQVYELASHDPRIDEELLAELSDVTIYRLSHNATP